MTNSPADSGWTLHGLTWQPPAVFPESPDYQLQPYTRDRELVAPQCGTDAAWRAHRRLGEDCIRCRRLRGMGAHQRMAQR